MFARITKEFSSRCLMQAAQDKVDALACGDDRTTIELTPDETEQASGALGWVDVTKLIEPKA